MELVGVSEQNQTKFTIEKDDYERESTKISNTPMGDFEYDDSATHPLSSDCSSSDFSEEIKLNTLCDTNEKLIEVLAEQLQQINQELNLMIYRIDNTEEDILKRRDFYRDMERLSLEYNKQIGRETEQIEKIEFLIDHLRNSMISRDDILENMKVVEINQLSDHFKRKKSDTSFSYYRESDVFASVASQ